MERILTTWKVRPPAPTRVCEKKMGPLDESLTARTTKSENGRKSRRPRPAASVERIWRVNCCEARRRKPSL
jgi:hypothetical protein